jgi:hypothetical protein
MKVAGEMPLGEEGRIGFLVQRDGRDATIAWVTRTMALYRRAVLAPGHFAGTPTYRRSFIRSYCEFKRWLVGVAEIDPDNSRSPS